MIDIHTHVLPGVDDGSKSMEMSLDMIRMAFESGVDTIVCTPHCMPGIYNNFASDQLEGKFLLLKEAVYESGIPVHIKKGMEVLVPNNIEELIDEKKVWTINDSDYLLVEFSFDEDPEYCTESLKKISDNGYTPIIAHPSRYYFVQDNPQIVYDWYQEGYGIQVNKGSLLGQFGRREKETANRLIRHGLVSCVASDAHRNKVRTTRMDELQDYLADRFGEEYMYMLTEENPGRILENKRLVGYDPLPFDED